jgi:hypothetical protein
VDQCRRRAVNASSESDSPWLRSSSRVPHNEAAVNITDPGSYVAKGLLNRYYHCPAFSDRGYPDVPLTGHCLLVTTGSPGIGTSDCQNHQTA